MIVLGINAYHGDASAALFRDGQLLAAVEEERFTRVKHAAGFPSHAVRWCLESNGVDAAEIDHVAIARKRSAHLARKALWAMRLPHLALGRSRAWKQLRGHPRLRSRTLLGVPTADLERGAALRRTPRRARGQLVLLVPVRGCRGALAGRPGRLLQHALGLRPRHGPGRRGLRLLPALPRLLLLGDYAVPGHVEVRRRVQGDGSRVVRQSRL